MRRNEDMEAGPVLIVVHGLPRPAGSKRAFARRVGDRLRVAVVDSSGEAGRAWREMVSSAAAVAMEGRGLLMGAVRVEAIFTLPRPKSHYDARGEVKRACVLAWHVVRPDVTKLWRAVEDALTGVVWRDDAQVVEQRIVKMYGQEVGVIVQVWEVR